MANINGGYLGAVLAAGNETELVRFTGACEGPSAESGHGVHAPPHPHATHKGCVCPRTRTTRLLGGPTIGKLITRLRDEYIPFKQAELSLSDQVRPRSPAAPLPCNRAPQDLTLAHAPRPSLRDPAGCHRPVRGH